MANREFDNINGIKVCDQTARDNIPTKTSQLENDSNFVTTAEMTDTTNSLDENISSIVEKLGIAKPLNLEFVIGSLNQDGSDDLNWHYSLMSNDFRMKSNKLTITNNSSGIYGFSLVKFNEDNTFTKVGVYFDDKFTLDVNTVSRYRILISKNVFEQLPDTSAKVHFSFFDGASTTSKVEIHETRLQSVENKVEEHETRLQNLATASRSLALPENYYILNGEEMKIPYISFIKDEIKNEYPYLRTSGYWEKHQFKNYFKYKGITGDSYMEFFLYNDAMTRVVEQKRMNLKVANTTGINPSEVKNFMILGDSFIQSGGIVDVIVNKLNELGVTNINYVGTSTDTDTGSHNKFEGHGGYRAYDFISDPATLRPEFPTNPFWNPSTNAVDFNYYCNEVVHVSGLDYVYIHLGVNDKLTDSLEGEEGNNTIVTRIVTLINHIHSAFPNCKIVVDGLVPLSEDNEFTNFYYYREDIFDYNSKLETALKAINNAYYIPSCLRFDSRYAYEYVNEKVYSNSDETRKVVKEWLHPSLVGYKMIADEVIPAFIYHCLMNN